jgi:hypothetical protein
MSPLTTTDAGLRLPLVFAPFNCVSFEGVVDGEDVFPLEPRLPTLDGRDGGLTMGVNVADKVLECRFGCWQSVRRRLRSTMNDRPCTLDMAPAVVVSDSSPPSLSFRERAVGVSS